MTSENRIIIRNLAYYFFESLQINYALNLIYFPCTSTFINILSPREKIFSHIEFSCFALDLY